MHSGSGTYTRVEDTAVDSTRNVIYSVGYVDNIPNYPEISSVDYNGNDDGFVMKYDLNGNVEYGFLSVTLRNIYSLAKYQWKTPDQVLEELDKEIQNILHRKEYREEPAMSLSHTDGIDISLCEIDLDTKEILIASAKRTSILKRNGKMEKLKGDNRSIGGLDLLKTKFTLKKFQFEKGDALYLFTDGFTDQFGGVNDKKLMISGLFDILEGLEDIEPDKHLSEIQSNFALWKSKTPQVDDLLLIGLQF